MQSRTECRCAVLPVSVAALMDAKYIAGHLTDAMGCDRIMIPGLCGGDARLIEDALGVEVIRGPECLKDIPAFLGENVPLEEYGRYSVKIIAEIVDAHKLSMDTLLEKARGFRESGADIIDLGCPVEGGFPGIASAITALKAEGFPVSVDSFNEDDIQNADRAGVDYLLSVNSRNLHLASRLRCRVVVIPDFGQGVESLDRNIARLEDSGVLYIIDPVLKPIGFGFAESIGEFISVRSRYPEAEMLMGTGNLTELTDADSAGITALLAGIIAELGIQYVLTTEVISWARGAVREMDIARRLMHYACTHKILPKRLDDGLITVKDPPFEVYKEEELRDMQKKVTDRNFRIFTDRDYIYVFNNRVFIRDTGVQGIIDRLDVGGNTAEAFYLGRELYKAALALKLGKRYVQEQELRWGYLSEIRAAREM